MTDEKKKPKSPQKPPKAPGGPTLPVEPPFDVRPPKKSPPKK